MLRYLSKKFIRGALTNGHKWIFLLVKLNNDGAFYHQSVPVQFETNQSQIIDQRVMSKELLDVIAGILVYWVSLTLI